MNLFLCLHLLMMHTGIDQQTDQRLVNKGELYTTGSHLTPKFINLKSFNRIFVFNYQFSNNIPYYALLVTILITKITEINFVSKLNF